MSDTPSQWTSMNDIFAAEETKLRGQRETKTKEPENQAKKQSTEGTPSPTIPPHPQPPPPVPTSLAIAPQRDFNRRANSLERDALPAGYFPGSSKKLYDAVYMRTRGAIQPRLELQATKRDLMQWSGIRNIKTIETHIRHLSTIGLMTRRGENGDSAGFFYGVRLPEELDFTPSPSPTIPHQQGAPQPSTSTNQKTVMEGDQNSVLVGEGQNIDNAGTSTPAKTSFKTNTEIDDDDALAAFVQTWREVTKEITGREPSKAESDRWRELAEIMATELKIAAARTTVSSVPSFLAEHLRRRLWKMDKKQASLEGKAEAGTTKSSISAEEARNCPDCGGSGMYYPDGYEKGVAKCRHEQLTNKSDTQETHNQ
jgi:hypothetical protein